MEDLYTIKWHNGKVRILDQRQLPNDLVLLEISDHRGIVNAINNMSIRGAPAIGIAAAFGVVLSVWSAGDTDRPTFLEKANTAIKELKETRPTAKNLFWALEKMRLVLTRNLNRPLGEIKKALLFEAQRILDDDIKRCENIGKYGATLLPDRAFVLTHCNAGALATGGYGTALGVIRAAVAAGKKIKVYANETRPLWQGARLTSFELLEDDIDVTLIVDSAAGAVMREGKINIVLVGADRIASNGDTANKIGTYSLAVLAKKHQIPFYVAAPLSTCDFDLPNGSSIPIEERDADEIRRIDSMLIAPEDVKVYNPAFDVTPNEFIDAIITERGIARPPFKTTLSELKNKT
jgi:methylthioribose-1-phosphate isomerase